LIPHRDAYGAKVPKNQGFEFPKPFASAPHPDASGQGPAMIPTNPWLDQTLRGLGFVKHCSALRTGNSRPGKLRAGFGFPFIQ